MAFAQTNIKAGSVGNKRSLEFNWTASVGDAAGTFVVGSSDGSLEVRAWSEDTTGSMDGVPLKYSRSVSGNKTTVTLYHLEGVTTGRCVVTYR